MHRGDPRTVAAGRRRGSAMIRQYAIYIEPGEDGYYIVHVPALPGCITQGRTIEEAQTNAKEAIEAYLESLRKHGLPIPDPTSVRVAEVSVEV
jgi:predicted RNase H-like HicB family nuclease